MSLREALRQTTDGPGSALGRSWRTRGARLLDAVGAHERRLWVLAVVAMVADLGLTVYGLGIGLRELNPVAVFAVGAAGPAGLAALKVLALGLAVACWMAVPDRYGSLVPLGVAVPAGAATAVNAVVIATAL